jgi:hypothetical protein
VRLVRQSVLKKLEARVSVSRRIGCATVWTRDESRIVRELEPGEFVAADMYLLESIGGGADLTWCVRLVERVTLDLETLKAVPA